MLLVTIAVAVLLGLTVTSVYEISIIYKTRAYRNKESIVECHSRTFEGGELFGFLFAGFLMYMSALDILLVAVVVIVGLYHLGGTLSSKEMMLQFSLEKLKRFMNVVMAISFVEMAVAVSVVAWTASNGLVGL